MLPKSERDAGKELGLVKRVMYKAWSGGQRAVVGILRHECGGRKNEMMLEEVEAATPRGLAFVVGRCCKLSGSRCCRPAM
jgi:hypothetical protein